MNKAQELHNLGQSLWLDNITREILDNGRLRRYMNEFSIPRTAAEISRSSDPVLAHDSSTNALIRRYRSMR